MILHHSQWLKDDFLGYLKKWIFHGLVSNLVQDESQKMIYSVETIEGLKITGMCLWCLSLCMKFYEDDRCRYVFDLGV